MTAVWGPAIKDLQDTLRQQINAQYVDDKATLVAPWNLEADILAAATTKGATLKACSIHVLTPGPGSDVRSIITDAFGGRLSFPVWVRVTALDRSVQDDLLRDGIGLVIDGYKRDVSLGGRCEGPMDPAVVFGARAGDGQVLMQELQVRVERLR